jgi:menaquinone-specific isochorismate synthase
LLGGSLDFDAESFLKQGVVLGTEPGRLLVGWGEMEWAAAPYVDSQAFYLPDFFLKMEEPWLHPQYLAEISNDELIRALGSVESPPEISWEAPSSLFFKEQFLAVKELISMGELKKGVPVTFEKGTCPTGRLFRRYLLGQLAAQSFPLRLYGYWENKEGIIGVTPEVLFDLNDKHQLKTMALAGTRPRDDKKRSLLLDDQKELGEHYIVVDYLSHALEDLGRVHSQPTEVMALPHLEHLMTQIEVKLRKPIEFEEVVHLLHPTPALGTFPRNAGKEFLKDVASTSDRRRFGAPFGIRRSGGEGLCLVAIRNVQWAGDSVEIGSGCGIVNESEFDREWLEQKLKRDSVKKMLGL